MEGFLTEEQVMEMLNLAQITLWRLRKEKKIAFYKIGKKIYYDPKDVDAFLEKSKVPAESDPKEAA